MRRREFLQTLLVSSTPSLCLTSWMKPNLGILGKEFTVIAGRSGTGKSVSARMIYAMALMAERKALFFDAEISRLSVETLCVDVAQSKPEIVILDGLQRISSGRKFHTREREVAFIAETLKELSVKYEVHVIATAQLNRGITGYSDRPPRLTDIRESRRISEVADTVLLLTYLEPGIVVAKGRSASLGFRGSVSF